MKPKTDIDVEVFYKILDVYYQLKQTIDIIQPGLVSPLPDGDPNIPDAMMMADAYHESRYA